MDDLIIEVLRETEELLATSDLLGGERARISTLQHKLENQSITISVIGQFKRGKSALVNALLEEEVLPVGIVPITSAVTEIRYGERSAFVHFKNGVIQSVLFDDLNRYINEQENPENHLCVTSVSLNIPSSFLQNGLTFVDTPGVGSYHKHNSNAAYAFVKESDAVIFMLSVDTPINEIEVEFLQSTRSFAAKFFFVVNKIDTVSDMDLQIYLTYCNKLLCKLMDVEKVIIFPVSAKYKTGIFELKESLMTECKKGIREILEASAQLKLKDIILSSLAQIELYWKVLLMPPATLKNAIRKMEETLEEFRKKAGTIVEREEANREFIIPGLEEKLKARLNEFKAELSASVTQLFGMDYHYALAQIDFDPLPLQCRQVTAAELGCDFLLQAESLCDELKATLRRILLYRNENTVEVVTQIYALNRMTRQLRRTRDLL
ncbi:MAG: hypothetical protein EOM59_01505 [Clostridia bacterium]|nr:hypothetical protein [Clostridia bacterium]